MQNKNNKNIKKFSINLLDRQAGFSLIEILVVMFIVVLVSTIGMVGYRSLKNSSQLDSSQREVSAAIKLAQSYAIQGRSQDIGGVQQVPCGYGFRFINNTDFQIFYNEPFSGRDCQSINAEAVDTNFEYNSSSKTLESFKLGGDVVLNYPSSVDDSVVYFSTPNASIYGNNIYRLQYQGAEKTIIINSVGSITEN